MVIIANSNYEDEDEYEASDKDADECSSKQHRHQLYRLYQCITVCTHVWVYNITNVSAGKYISI